MNKILFIACLFCLILGCASDLNENVPIYQSYAFVRCNGKEKQLFDKVENKNGTLFGTIDNKTVKIGKSCDCTIRQYDISNKGFYCIERKGE